MLIGQHRRSIITLKYILYLLKRIAAFIRMLNIRMKWNVQANYIKGFPKIVIRLVDKNNIYGIYIYVYIYVYICVYI